MEKQMIPENAILLHAKISILNKLLYRVSLSVFFNIL